MPDTYDDEIDDPEFDPDVGLVFPEPKVIARYRLARIGEDGKTAPQRKIEQLEQELALAKERIDVLEGYMNPQDVMECIAEWERTKTQNE